MIGLPGHLIGVRHSVTYSVAARDIVTGTLPGVPAFAAKPRVMATGRLLTVAEWPAMEVIARHIDTSQDSVGTNVHSFAHLAPVLRGATLSVTAECLGVGRRRSTWAVQAYDDFELVASGVLGFVVVDTSEFERRRVAPKRARVAAMRAAAASTSPTTLPRKDREHARSHR